MPSSKRRRNFTKRSLTGCRTCRARHIRCDEALGSCNNCTSTGRKCDGYDLSRLPATRRVALTAYSGIDTRLSWLTTPDEMRCFSYFTHCSIPSLASYFDFPLWRKLTMQISHVDRAVYHAATMLGAVHEDSDLNKMRLAGENLRLPRHRFAFEQASRAFAILNKRKASQDPQLREVVLICCLLFIVSDLLLGRYDHAFQHLRSGLRILGEIDPRQLRAQHGALVDSGLVRVFERLDIESSHFGQGSPTLCSYDELEERLDQLYVMRNLHEVHDRVALQINMGVPFLAKCWVLSEVEIQADYEDLHRKQQRLLCANYKSKQQIEILTQQSYHQLTSKEHRSMDLLLLQCVGQILALKTCLKDGPAPTHVIPEHVELLTIYGRIMSKFPDRPTITLDFGVIPCLYVVASQCPQYSVRIRAIDALLSWPHCEGLVNSNLAASVALEGLKAELRDKDERTLLCVNRHADADLQRYLRDTLQSSMHDTSFWPMRPVKNIQQ
ncbi:hypothetical protein BJY04DRAFT_229123 [Aspergillus karnatakaensis]|uniref:Zn(II)2Cys6 transcription factor domain-containing protein n=1 Tax=Aspergillus karnatakaensis TaxID=1810916 RepID=UPI003CCCA46C